MRRNKSYIILAMVALLSLFTISASCNFCGVKMDTAPTESRLEEEPETEETASMETEAAEANTQEEDNSQESQADTDKIAPTIRLEISEGPTYSADDDVCWYRVKATVTGNPSPEITWSQDNSNGSFGNTIAQVNLTRDDPSYTLTAVAANSEGTFTDHIELTWGCDEEEIIEEENNCPVIGDFMPSTGMETYPCHYLNFYICYATDPDGDVLTYNWDLSAGTVISIDNNASLTGGRWGSIIDFYTPDTPGTITLKVTVSDGACEVSMTDIIEVVNE